MEESGLNNPVFIRVQRCNRGNASGFTLIEVLVALFVVAVGSSIFIKMYIASLSLSGTSTRYSVASQIAEEYMAELQMNPGQFVWPNFDGEAGNLLEVKLLDEESPLMLVAQPSAMPIGEAAYNRESSLYNNFNWVAFARIHDEQSNFVEVVVRVDWDYQSRPYHFYLPSVVPRSAGEGSGLGLRNGNHIYGWQDFR